MKCKFLVLFTFSLTFFKKIIDSFTFWIYFELQNRHEMKLKSKSKQQRQHELHREDRYNQKRQKKNEIEERKMQIQSERKKIAQSLRVKRFDNDYKK